MIPSNSAGNNDEDADYSPDSADDNELQVDNSNFSKDNEANDPTDEDEDSVESQQNEAQGREEENPVQSIIDAMSNIPETEIGNFVQSNQAFKSFSRVITAFRKGTDGNDFQQISKNMTSVLELQEVDKLFNMFRGIYEFIMHIHKTYKVQLSANISTENNQLLAETMETAIRKYMQHSLYTLFIPSYFAYSVYYHETRKQKERGNVLPYPQQFQIDTLFNEYLLVKAKELTRHSIYLYLFPPDMQVLIESLLSCKPANMDFGGLLALIMFSAIDDEKYFLTEIIDKAFLPTDLEDSNSMLYESQQNLSALLFGITLDDVRKNKINVCKSSELTFVVFPVYPIFRKCSDFLLEQEEFIQYSPENEIPEIVSKAPTASSTLKDAPFCGNGGDLSIYYDVLKDQPRSSSEKHTRK